MSMFLHPNMFIGGCWFDNWEAVCTVYKDTHRKSTLRSRGSRFCRYDLGVQHSSYNPIKICTLNEQMLFFGTATLLLLAPSILYHHLIVCAEFSPQKKTLHTDTGSKTSQNTVKSYTTPHCYPLKYVAAFGNKIMHSIILEMFSRHFLVICCTWKHFILV